MRANPEAGEPLPNPFKQFAQYGIYERRGQVSLVASASGGGKSAYATHAALHSDPPVPTLYCSADTDPHTLGTRVAASVLNRFVSEMEQLLRDDDKPTWDAVAARTGNVWFYWNTAPSCEDLGDEVEAYAIEMGEWPHKIVVDNLINVAAEGQGHEAKDEVMVWLQQLAKYTNAHVQVLHHVTKMYVNGTVPIPKEGLLDSVDKRPRLILTMYRVDENHIGVRVVKNSSGPAQGDASYGPDLGVMMEKQWMTG